MNDKKKIKYARLSVRMSYAVPDAALVAIYYDTLHEMKQWIIAYHTHCCS